MIIKFALAALITFSVNAINYETSLKVKAVHSPAREQRIDSVILHFTNISREKTFNLFTSKNAKTSAHYVVDTNGDIYLLVPENEMAFHAGISSWKNRKYLNSSSIGIEIINIDGNKYEYTEKQIKAVIELCKDIKVRHGIKTEMFLGHSDVAPDRKYDPGIKFPWKRFAQEGIGIWYKDINLKRPEIQEILKLEYEWQNTRLEEKTKELLASIGYDTTFYRDSLRAFRRHYNIQDLSRDFATIRDLAIMLNLIDVFVDKA